MKELIVEIPFTSLDNECKIDFEYWGEKI